MKIEQSNLTEPSTSGAAPPTRGRPESPSSCPAQATLASCVPDGGPRRGGREARGRAKLRVGWRTPWLLLPLLGLGAFAVLFVGSDVIATQLLPTMSTAWRHGVLTGMAGVITLITSTVVYLVTRHEHRKLSATAGQLSRLISSYQADPAHPGRFENPHLVHCRDVLDCQWTNCPMHDARGERCWQVMALNHASLEGGNPRVEIGQCLQCEVYRRSCPDKLTELGESFNNLMFLLEEEAKQVGRMRAHMVEKEKMVAIGQIAAGIAHEVGNPLSSISSIVQMLKRKPASTPTSEALDLIETHIQRISTTVRQLVSLARPGATRWEHVDVKQILEEAVRLIAFDRRAKNVEIELLPSDSLPRTYGLRGQLQQVIINLALNALDAMPDGGKLSIQAAWRRGNIVVRVQDTGCGIPAEFGRRIFDPFFTTKDPGEGTGLGLAVSYGIVQKHGGEIDFNSVEGKGTVFTVTLPILDRPPDV